MNIRKVVLAAIASLIFAGAPNAQPAPTPSIQPAPIKRIPLQKFDVPGTTFETIIGIAEIAPNVNIGRHTHPGVESGYLLEGELTLLLEGQPPRLMKPGGSYQIPPNGIHDARSGDKGAKVIATYVVEKGKPLATPAP